VLSIGAGDARNFRGRLAGGHLPAIEAARVALFRDHKPVDTLLGVETLAHPGCLLEVEAIAVIGG
jgi:enamine deaminase RidA (YjgF/YER057c/UK114 family)